VSEQNLIQIKNLEFSYGQESILKISEWNLKKVDQVFLQGASGSGKTTFLEILSGVLKAQMGSYQFDHQEVFHLSDSQRDQLRLNKISLIFQNFNLIPYLSVEENILMPFTLGAKYPVSSSETLQLMNQLLQELGIESLKNQKAQNISHGQAQRVAAIRAFMKQPLLLLADEPTSALDENSREAF
jgi:putative ABC transport system ATP-binding protein